MCDQFRLDQTADNHLFYIFLLLFPIWRCLFRELKQAHSEGDGIQDFNQKEIQIELDHISQVISGLWGKAKLTNGTGGMCPFGHSYRGVAILVEQPNKG